MQRPHWDVTRFRAQETTAPVRGQDSALQLAELPYGREAGRLPEPGLWPGLDFPLIEERSVRSRGGDGLSANSGSGAEGRPRMAAFHSAVCAGSRCSASVSSLLPHRRE